MDVTVWRAEGMNSEPGNEDRRMRFPMKEVAHLLGRGDLDIRITKFARRRATGGAPQLTRCFRDQSRGATERRKVKCFKSNSGMHGLLAGS
jgi:hypothetical protein